MPLGGLARRIYTRLIPDTPDDGPRVRRGPMVLVVVMDGTLCTLDPGHESNAGLVHRLMQGQRANVMQFYEAGLQWRDWNSLGDVMTGRGINSQIRRAYGWLAAHYRPGDQIYLFGYSRGAYAVRSLAGVIDRVGLLQRDCATERNIQTVYRHYKAATDSASRAAFTARHCHADVMIEGIFVWDTVKALGVRLPILWRYAASAYAFHDHRLSRNVKAGFQALALDETRLAYEPVLWDCPEGWTGRIEQAWFRGSHGDVGGQVDGHFRARGLSNIPLVWMLDHAERCGLPLPPDWRDRFPCDPDAPSIGTWKGFGKLFLNRARRVVGRDRSERLHASVPVAVQRRFTPAVSP